MDEEVEAFRKAFVELHKGVSIRISQSVRRQQDGLKKELEDFKRSHAGTSVEICDVDIPDGENQDEQDVIVQKMYDQIGPEEVVFFDLTHGFRSIPILAMTILNYARITKKIQVGGLYYGAFEAKVKTKGSNSRRLEETSIGIAAVRWAISKNLTQQGLTALEATITTYVVELCGFDSYPHLKHIIDVNKYKERECISKALLGRNGYDMQQKINQAKPVIQNRFSASDYNKLKNCCEDVKNARNSINHFGLTDQASYTYEDLNSILRAQFNIFLERVDSDCVCTNGNQNVLEWTV